MTPQQEDIYKADKLYKEEWRNRLIALAIGGILGLLVAAIEQFIWHIFLD